MTTLLLLAVLSADYLVSDYGGDWNAASTAAAATCGRVVFDQIYTLGTYTTLQLRQCVTYDGEGRGGLKRPCAASANVTVQITGEVGQTITTDAPVAAGSWLVARTAALTGSIGSVTIDGAQIITYIANPGGGAFTNGPIMIGDYLFKQYTLATYTPLSPEPTDITIRGMEFDGNEACNTFTHDWRYNTTLALKGQRNIIENSYFHDTPSENITSCGTTIRFNRAENLGGSFVHISCATAARENRFIGNYVNTANVFTDAVMGHSEGVITLSANTAHIRCACNWFLNSGESGIGDADSGDEDIVVVGDRYTNIGHVFTSYGNVFDNSTVQLLGVTLESTGGRQHCPTYATCAPYP